MSDDKLKNKQSFVINNEHADMIVNDLLKGDFEALGRIFTDLVNYNLYGDETIVEYECTDKAERTARRLLKVDSEHYIKSWLARSDQNAKNRKSGATPTNDEVRDYCKAKGYNEQIAIDWAFDKAHNNWCDDAGEPIKYWKKSLDAYMRGVTRNQLNDFGNSLKYK